MRRLPDLRLPDLKLPSPRLGRPRLDLDDPGQLADHLRFFFYLLMFVALLAVFAGATGTGVVMLVAGAGLHVLGSSLEEVAARRLARRQRAARKKQVRLRSHRAAQRVSAAEIRVAATPRLGSRPRPAVAQPGPSPARKQRVI